MRIRYVFMVWTQYGEDVHGMYSTPERARRAQKLHCKYDHSQSGGAGYTETPHQGWPMSNTAVCGVTRYQVDA